jgi:hypothetical protein
MDFSIPVDLNHADVFFLSISSLDLSKRRDEVDHVSRSLHFHVGFPFF